MSQDMPEYAPDPLPPPLLEGPASDTTPVRPDQVPEKFWDAATGTVRIDALLKSYRELERRLSQRMVRPAPDAPAEEHTRFPQALGVPATPAEYAIRSPHPLLPEDAALNARMHAQGFTPPQAQLVYDLAAEHLLPLIADAVRAVDAARQTDRLHAHFGGEEPYRRIATQIAAWGGANLPPSVFDTLCTSCEGVIALHDMMAKREPALMRAGDAPAPSAEQELRAMMRDPRYWRNREPDFVKRVTDGFRRLTRS